MAVTFAVDDVVPTTELLPTRRRADEAGDVLALGGDPELAVVETFGFHPLVASVHRAFAEHRRLVLSPDAVWLTVAQGVAQHVRLNAEALRSRLVRHAGKKTLAVAWDGPPPRDPAAWLAIVEAFRGRVGDEIGAGRARLFLCDFSTSSAIDRVASEVVLMDAMSPFFDYELTCICGIPAVTLLGTAEDWRRIRERIDVIAELDLAHWARSLVPIADQLVAAAEGRADAGFWRWIYKPRAAYGGETFSGWIGRLFPYLEGAGGADRPNPMLDQPFESPRSAEGGIRPASIPRGPSHARVRVTDGSGATLCEIELEGGLTSMVQEADGALRAVSGFAVREAGPSMELVADRIRAEHRFTPPQPRRREMMARVTGPAEIMVLYQHLEEATLFEGERAWHIRPPHRHDRDAHSLRRIVDLPGGAYLASHTRHRLDGRVQTHYVRGHDARPDSDLDVVGTSLAAILARALDAGGALEPLSQGSLAALIADLMSRERAEALAAKAERTRTVRASFLSALVARARA